jgi:hypothetical protein
MRADEAFAVLCNCASQIRSHLYPILSTLHIFYDPFKSFFPGNFLLLHKGPASGVLATVRSFISSGRFNRSKFTRFPLTALFYDFFSIF